MYRHFGIVTCNVVRLTQERYNPFVWITFHTLIRWYTVSQYCIRFKYYPQVTYGMYSILLLQA
jgi:hypothetical protein